VNDVNAASPQTSRCSVDLSDLRGLRLAAHVPHRSYRLGDRIGKGVGGRMEFVDHRPYAPGDDLRRVDWNAAARTERLVVKRHARDAALPVHIGIDVSASMSVGEPSGLDAARALARGVAFVGLAAGASVTLLTLGRSAEVVARASRSGAIATIDAGLATVSCQEDADVARALRTYAARSRDTGIFVLLSDFLNADAARGCFRALTSFEAAAAHVVPAALFDTPPPGAIRVTDAETQGVRDLRWDDNAAVAYGRRRDELLAAIPHVAASLGVRYAGVRTDRVTSDVFLKEFRAAGIVA
jgi:uncharacterized protein (DUF58 family)